MSRRSRPYEEGLYKWLQDDKEAACYLEIALEDSQHAFRVALKNVLEARNLAEVARASKLDRANIYRMLSDTGNPTLKSLDKILGTLGMRLKVVPDKRRKAVAKAKAVKPANAIDLAA